jgi:hypothetical protein
VSSTNRGLARAENDFYPTPPWLTKAVAPILELRLRAIGAWPVPKVYEPAAGQLHIVNTLLDEWPEAHIEYSDIDERLGDYGGIDFLTAEPEPIFDLIITNPPYFAAKEFKDRAKLWLKNDQSMIAFMLRLNFLGSQKRAKWHRADLPSLATTPKRPAMGKNKQGKLGTDSTEYAWFIWPQDEPYLSILETEDME